LLAPLRPLLADADVALLNVEGAIGTGRAPQKCGPKSTSCFAFRQAPAVAAAFRRVVPESSVVVGNVANNHSRDAGPDGFVQTRAHLDSAGVFVAGADTLATAVSLASGDTIGVLGFHTSVDAPDARDIAAVRRHVARAVKQFGTVIVAVHIGGEGVSAQRTRNATEKFLGMNRGNPVGFARAAMSAGATAVFGHGPHVLRAAEWQDEKIAFYSLGNLLTYGPFRNREPQNRGAIACTVIDGPGRVSSAELRPTVQVRPGVLEADTAKRAIFLVDSLSALDFPRTGATISPEGAVGKRASPKAQPPGRTAATVSSSNASTRRAPRQARTSGEGVRSMRLSMTRPATLLAWMYRPFPM
jgi:hypothetical protein